MSNNIILSKISVTVKNRLSNAISSGITKMHTEDLLIEELATENYKRGLPWDIINTCLLDAFGESNLLISKKKSGTWDFILLYDSGSDTIITLMRQQRFRGLKPSDIPIYIASLLELNHGIEPIQQTLLFEQEPLYDIDFLHKRLDDICSDFKNSEEKIIGNHVLVVFDEKHNMLKSATAYILNNQYQICEEEDWTEGIVLDIGQIEDSIESESEPNVTLDLSDKSTMRLDRIKKLPQRKKDIDEKGESTDKE